MNYMFLNPLSMFIGFSIVINSLIYLLKREEVDALNKTSLELFCCFIPATFTPLTGYFVGGFLLTLKGPTVKSVNSQSA